MLAEPAVAIVPVQQHEPRQVQHALAFWPGSSRCMRCIPAASNERDGAIWCEWCIAPGIGAACPMRSPCIGQACNTAGAVSAVMNHSPQSPTRTRYQRGRCTSVPYHAKAGLGSRESETSGGGTGTGLGVWGLLLAPMPPVDR